MIIPVLLEQLIDRVIQGVQVVERTDQLENREHDSACVPRAHPRRRRGADCGFHRATDHEDIVMMTTLSSRGVGEGHQLAFR